MVNGLDYDGVRFPVSKEYYSKIEKKNSICINVFGYENDLVYPVNVLDKKIEDCMGLLLITGHNKSYYFYIKMLIDLYVIKQSIREKNVVSDLVSSSLKVKKFWYIIKGFV